MHVQSDLARSSPGQRPSAALIVLPPARQHLTDDNCVARAVGQRGQSMVPVTDKGSRKTILQSDMVRADVSRIVPFRESFAVGQRRIDERAVLRRVAGAA